MNASMTKMSEKMVNNSSTSSIKGTASGKLKLKFKPNINQTLKETQSKALDSSPSNKSRTKQP